jgi:putative nucleotidyltransferase with HDIG domain
VERRVLFLVDDRRVLRDLETGLRSASGEWVASFVASLPDARDQLDRREFDLVVADAATRGLDAGVFLDEVAVRQPAAARFLLSDGIGRSLIMRAGGTAHQHLSKPLQPDHVFARLSQTLALGDLLAEPQLKGLVSRLKAVPSLPPVYLAIMTELRNEEASAHKVGELVAKDAGMAAKILQLVNSPFFGLRMSVADPAHAVQLLGLETVRALVLSLHVFEQLDLRTVTRFRLGKVWRHSLAAGAFARTIALMQDSSTEASSAAVTATLLHDIGKLVLASSLYDDYGVVVDQAVADKTPVWTVEREMLGVTHAEVGAFLLSLWGLPEAIVESVAWHHRPSLCPAPAFGPLGAVHVADVIEHRAHPADNFGGASAPDDTYLADHQVNWQFPAWLDACVNGEGGGNGHGLAARM